MWYQRFKVAVAQHCKTSGGQVGPWRARLVVQHLVCVATILGYLVRTGIDLIINKKVLYIYIPFARADLPSTAVRRHFRGWKKEDNGSPCENGPPGVLWTVTTQLRNHPGWHTLARLMENIIANIYHT